MLRIMRIITNKKIIKSCIDKYILYLSRFIKTYILKRAKNGIAINEKDLTEKPKKLRITKEKMINIMVNQGLSQKLYDFNFNGINMFVIPYPRNISTNIVNMGYKIIWNIKRRQI